MKLSPATPPPLRVDASPMSRLAGIGLVVGITASLLASFLLLVWRTEAVDTQSVGTDSFSVSAIGHSLLDKLLRDTGRQVVRSRFQSGGRASRSLLLVLEPPPDRGTDLEGLLEDVDRALVVLPKRTGDRDPAVEHWLGSDDLRRELDVVHILHRLTTEAKLVRSKSEVTFTGTGDLPSLPTPTIHQPQLIDGSGFRPLIHSREGTLLAELDLGYRTIYLLTDPDPLANHGIDDDDNAAFVLGMLDALRDGRSMVLDETLHGFELQPSLWEELGRFPLVLLLAQLLLLLAVIGWAAAGRFGPLFPRPPALANDKGFLLDNIADLLARGGHHTTAVRRYFAVRIRQVAMRGGARHGDEAAMTRTVASQAKLNGRGESFAAVQEQVAGLTETTTTTPLQALQLARRIHEECEEIRHGSE